MVVILPTISATGEGDDALDEIPIPTESTEGHVVLTTDLCQLNMSYTMSFSMIGLDALPPEHWGCDKLVWNGTFEEHDDSDVLKIENNEDGNIGMIRICIENSDVPMEIELWTRNTSALIEIDNSTKADTPAQISICKMYGASSSDSNEHWLNLNSLSTSGDYSISVTLIEFEVFRGWVGDGHIATYMADAGIFTPIMPVQLEPFTHYSVAYSDDGEHNAINTSVDSPHVIYNLNSHSTTPHTLLISCHDETGLVWDCGNINSTFGETDIYNLHHAELIYYPPENTSMIEIKISSQDVSTWIVTNQKMNNYSEINGGDASSNVEHCGVEGQSCGDYQNANMGTSIRGYLPMALFDESDVWELAIPGNEGDTFIAQINARSSEENAVLLEIFSVGTEGNITTYHSTIGTTWKSQSIDLESGTHHIKLTNLILLGSDYNWSYGDTTQSVITYDLKIDWVANVTNNSDFLGPSEELLYWDNILLWSMGPLFLLPLLYILISMRIDLARKNEFLFNLERLKRLRKIISEDELVEAKQDLKISLKALANIEWEIILENWGPPEISYQTEDMDLACWVLDSRLSNKGGTPIMLGINVKGEKWENAAVKFDTAKGKEQAIISVKPKLLFLDNELFLDQLGSKSRTFVQVDLNSFESIVNIHISGLQNNKPVAAQPAQGLELTNEEE